MSAGIKTTIGFFQSVLTDDDFQRGIFDTGFIARWLERRGFRRPAPPEQEKAAILAAGLHFLSNGKPQDPAPHADQSAWKQPGKRAMLRD